MGHENLTAQSSDRRSQLFTVRLWREPGTKERMEIRGKVKHVLTGEVQYFRDWGTMEEFMAAQMDAGEGDSTV